MYFTRTALALYKISFFFFGPKIESDKTKKKIKIKMILAILQGILQHA